VCVLYIMFGHIQFQMLLIEMRVFSRIRKPSYIHQIFYRKGLQHTNELLQRMRGMADGINNLVESRRHLTFSIIILKYPIHSDDAVNKNGCAII